MWKPKKKEYNSHLKDFENGSGVHTEMRLVEEFRGKQYYVFHMEFDAGREGEDEKAGASGSQASIFRWKLRLRHSVILKFHKKLAGAVDLQIEAPQPGVFKASWTDEEKRENLTLWARAVFGTKSLWDRPNVREFGEVSRFSFDKRYLFQDDVDGHFKKGKEGFVGFVSGHTGRARSGYTTWNSRWLVLRANFIAYYKHPTDQSPMGCFMIDDAFRCTIIEETRFLILTNSHRVLKLRIGTVDELHQWNYAIQGHYKSVLRCVLQSVNLKQLRSFAPMRDSIPCHWFIGGSNYMATCADFMEAAKEQIFITDWWLTPTLHLKRQDRIDVKDKDHWRLDNLLKRKANDGVRIYILLFQEVEGVLPNASLANRKYLQGLHPNISVICHRNFTALAFFWSHHEKFVVVDQTSAFVGGIDLAVGRWDNHEHKLTDEHAEFHAGDDYYNPGFQQQSGRYTEWLKDQKKGYDSGGGHADPHWDEDGSSMQKEVGNSSPSSKEGLSRFRRAVKKQIEINNNVTR
jgi:hypothetical protein